MLYNIIYIVGKVCKWDWRDDRWGYNGTFFPALSLIRNPDGVYWLRPIEIEYRKCLDGCYAGASSDSLDLSNHKESVVQYFEPILEELKGIVDGRNMNRNRNN